MEPVELLSKLETRAYKGRYGIYSKPGEVVVRTYKSDGSQHKTTGGTLQDAVLEMLKVLTKDKK